MDQDRFDHLLRSLNARLTRRIVLASLAGGLFTALPLALSVEESAARKKRHGKKHKKHSLHQQQPDSPPSPPTTPSPPPPLPLAPITHVDASCRTLSPSTIGAPDGNYRFAQTFNAVASGSLEGADLQILKVAGSGGDFILRLSPLDTSGVPTNVVLASTAIPNLSVPAGVNHLAFTFANPASVIAGTTYALVLTRPGANSLIWLAHDASACSGNRYQSTSQTESFLLDPGTLVFDFISYVSS